MLRDPKKRMISIGVFLILISGVWGCADVIYPRTTFRDWGPEVKKTVQTSYRFDDIPIPPGMNFNRRASFVYETKNTKTGLLIYEGKGEMERLADFYKQQMPNYEWKLLSSFELQNVMLVFVKEGWISVIYIQPQNPDDEMKKLEIRVGPIEFRLPSQKTEPR